MSELFREIEEDIRSEQIQRIWARFGRFMVWASVAIVLGTAAGVLWKDHKRSRAALQTSQLMKGIDQFNAGDFKGASSSFEVLTNNTSSPYYGIAMLKRAQAQIASNDKEAAARTYQVLAQHNPTKNDAALENMGPTDAHVEIKKDSPLYYTLMEWKAWQCLGQDKTEEAVALFMGLHTDAVTPATMRERVDMVLAYLAPEQLASSKEKAVVHE